MERKQSWMWIVGAASGRAGAMAMPMSQFLGAGSRSERANARAAERAAEGENIRQSYDDLSPVVRESLDRERGGRKVMTVYLAKRVDRSWYSVAVVTRHGDRIIRLVAADTCWALPK